MAELNEADHKIVDLEKVFLSIKFNRILDNGNLSILVSIVFNIR